MTDEIKQAVVELIKASIDKEVNETIALRSAPLQESHVDGMINEAWSVEATAPKGGGTKTLSISNFAELKKLAKTGKYEYFQVTKPNGDEVEYHVDFKDGNKLIEM